MRLTVLLGLLVVGCFRDQPPPLPLPEPAECGDYRSCCVAECAMWEAFECHPEADPSPAGVTCVESCVAFFGTGYEPLARVECRVAATSCEQARRCDAVDPWEIDR